MAEHDSKRVYTAEDIQHLLQIGRTKAYSYLEEVYKTQTPFRVIKVGRLYRVPKKEFDEWIGGDN